MKRTFCSECDGATIVANCSCGTDPRCMHMERPCPKCDGVGLQCPVCDDPLDSEAHEVCLGCRKSCPVCEVGTLSEGVLCGWCRDQQHADENLHQRRDA